MASFVNSLESVASNNNIDINNDNMNYDDDLTLNNLVINENGALINNSSLNPCVDAFNKLVRGITDENLNNYVNEIIKFANESKNSEVLVDLFLLTFHKRNCRGGEGEKLITYKLLLKLYDYYPQSVLNLISVLPIYGYYKDYFKIWEIVCSFQIGETLKYQKYSPLINKMVEVMLEQIEKDNKNLIDKTNDEENGFFSISLLGKWMPRQGNHFDLSCYWYHPSNIYKKVNCVLYISSMMYNQLPIRKSNNGNNGNKVNSWILKEYRENISNLTIHLNVPEVLMCAHQYSFIEFEKVASKAMKNYAKAFLNEKIKGVLANEFQVSGNRYPLDEDRVKTRNNLCEFIIDGKLSKLNGSQLDPHEIMSQLVKSSSNLEKEILRAQWNKKKEDVLEQVNKMLEEVAYDDDDNMNMNLNETINSIGRCIPMIDVSGSMCGKGSGSNVEPIQVAVALGIMTSELATPPFNNLAISFTETPRVFKFGEDQHPDEKRNLIFRDQMGYSTQFGKAIDLILDLCVKNNVPSSDIPNLLVFTDGQFNDMNSQAQYQNYYKKENEKISWKTCHEELIHKWANAGYDRVPTIIYWNLRANTSGFQTSADLPGVQLLQGYSPSLLKFVLFGEKMSETEITTEVETEDGQIVKMKRTSITPYETFRKAVDQEAYLPIRTILSCTNELNF
jgi:hypothetical protein